jgi:MoaA/NifB/PqqE/SkfB family radical SAM enzyme
MNNHFEVVKTKNGELNICEYEKGAEYLSSYPRIVFIELTRNCNLRCFMCKPQNLYPSKYNTDYDMGFDNYKKIADELFPYAEIVDLHGLGESTIIKNFEKYYDYCLSFDCKTRIVTNLVGIPEHILCKIIRNNSMLALSIDSPNKEGYEKIRCGAKYELMVHKLNLVNEYREQYNVHNHITVHMLLYFDNLHEISAMVEFAKRFGIQRVLIWGMEISKSNSSNVIYHLEKAHKHIEEGFERANELGVELRISESLTRIVDSKKVLKFSRCIAPWMYTAVNYNGEISFCDCRTEPSPTSLKGNNAFRQSFSDIWNNTAYLNMRKAFCSGVDKVAELETGCSKCSLIRFIDFEDHLYEPFKKRVVNNKDKYY